MCIIIPIAIALLVIYVLSFYNTIRLMRKFWVYGEKVSVAMGYCKCNNSRFRLLDLPLIQSSGMQHFSKTKRRKVSCSLFNFLLFGLAEFVDIFIELANEARQKGANLMRVQMMGKIYVWPLNGKTAAVTVLREDGQKSDFSEDLGVLHRG